ncbi:hypothetical protein JRQ81_004056 [Phrynocephalus forsythii]|uniref:Uncharacterized protein n=1 Tax=Phrynocephalus forsythii TaxID=171643 RepID=A0A9Q1AY05_9SAUR|nr:hypothetical protein JRQ81_004056 [Phrynocephalus forsythii]
MENFHHYHTVVQAAYPKRGWHLTNQHLSMLKARQIASNEVALRYDEELRKRASKSEDTWWDHINKSIWIVELDRFWTLAPQANVDPNPFPEELWSLGDEM